MMIDKLVDVAKKLQIFCAFMKSKSALKATVLQFKHSNLNKLQNEKHAEL